MEERLLKQARARAAKYCSMRERAPRQVLEKLLSWNLNLEEAEDIIRTLTDEQFLDEGRFCRAFCHDKFELNHWGRNRIRMELKKFRLPDQVVSDGLSRIDRERYLQVLNKLAEKKWTATSANTDDWIRRKKTADYLLRKGYESDLVLEVVNQLSHEKH